MNLRELKKRISTIIDKTPDGSLPYCDLQKNSLNSSNPCEIDNSKVAGICFFVRIPNIFLSGKKIKTSKDGDNFIIDYDIDKKTKTAIGYYCILKSLTKSDRIKFKSFTELANQLFLSKSQVFKVIKNLEKRKLISLIEVNNQYHLILSSYQKAIKILLNKDIKRQKIKFQEIKFETGKYQYLSYFLKEFYRLQIHKQIENQKFHIKRKTINYAAKDKYFLNKEEKLKKILSISDSITKGATLEKYTQKIKSVSNKYLRKKYSISENEYKNYSYRLHEFTIKKQISDIDLSDDNFLVMLHSRKLGFHLNLSHTRANQLLNEFNFLTSKYRLSNSEKKIATYKKIWQQGNFYQFSENYFYARVF